MGNCCIHPLNVNNTAYDVDKKNAHNHELEKLLKNNILKKNNIIKWNNKFDSECTICLEDFKQTDDIYITQCLHIYHDNCLLLWAYNSNVCPICRYKFY